MEWLNKASRSRRRLRLNWWERIFAWIRKVLKLNKQRPSPLKELKCRT